MAEVVANCRKSFGVSLRMCYHCTVFKRYLSVFLVLLIISQTLVNVGIGVYYHINKTYITQKLCENRSNPKLHCNGHCYLSKQLKKAEEGAKKQAQNFFKEKDEIITTDIKILPEKHFPNYTVTQFKTTATSLYFSDNYKRLIKPPTV